MSKPELKIIAKKKEELANKLLDALANNSKYLQVGIFHYDTLIVDVVSLMKQATDELSILDLSSPYYLFDEEDYRNFRMPTNKVNSYIDYRDKVHSLVIELRDIRRKAFELIKKQSELLERTKSRLEVEYNKIKEQYKKTNVDEADYIYYIANTKSKSCEYLCNGKCYDKFLWRLEEKLEYYEPYSQPYIPIILDADGIYKEYRQNLSALHITGSDIYYE